MLSTEQDRIVFRAQRMIGSGASEELNALLDQVTDPESRDSLISEALAFNNFSAVLQLVSQSTGNDQLSRVFKRASDCKACNVVSELCKRGFLNQNIIDYQIGAKELFIQKKNELFAASEELLRSKLECEISIIQTQIIPDSGLLLMFLQNSFEAAKEGDINKYADMARTIIESSKDERLSGMVDALEKHYKENNISVTNQVVKDAFFKGYGANKSLCVLS